MNDTGTTDAGIVGQRRVREENEVLAPLAAARTISVARLLAGKLAEELLDVLDFERTLLELVLSDVIFHGTEQEL